MYNLVMKKPSRVWCWCCGYSVSVRISNKNVGSEWQARIAPHFAQYGGYHVCSASGELVNLRTVPKTGTINVPFARGWIMHLCTNCNRWVWTRGGKYTIHWEIDGGSMPTDEPCSMSDKEIINELQSTQNGSESFKKSFSEDRRI